MEKTEYLCRCGATNNIPAKANNIPSQKKRSEDAVALFWCHACGKPSWDICQHCSYRTPAESRHTFCQGCGAGRETILQGAFQFNVWGDALFVFKCLMPVIVLSVFFPTCMKWIFQKIDFFLPVPLPQKDRLELPGIPMIVGSFVLLFLVLYKCYLARVLYALVRGKRQLSMRARLLEVWLETGSEDRNEAQQRRLVERARRVRTGVRLLGRRVRRWARSQVDKNKQALHSK